ncbi:branched-chain amino acid transaminase [Dickeya fangzhongdai]|uniref:branched-chain amino acid transaminase n=1 Tax=Dickeya fangzhongdai TaxID=1778540 RepID=UPI0026DF11A9|nr:branched-chain amino acid transaminase [Dickeya fangzhongdai]WKV52729.1 branched-chain amino acid transaminase [Dickeya fangzhongdai]
MPGRELSGSTSGVPVHHPWIYLDGDIVPSNQASIPVTTQAFNYGTGVFEGIRAYLDASGTRLNVFRLDAHIDRLLHSASLLMLEGLPDAAGMKMIILDLLSKNKASGDCYIRPIAFKKNLLPGTGFGVKLSGVSTGFSINSLNMRSYVNPQGVRCALSHWRRVADCSIPARAKITGSYVNSALAMEAAKRAGFDDALMLNSDGNLAEATTSNIFMVRNGCLITPPVNAHILEGITRDTVITLAKRCLGLNVDERNILPSELLGSDECFLSGTGVEILPVRQIEHQLLRSHEENSLSLTIHDLYMKAVRGQLDEFTDWLTPVNSY